MREDHLRPGLILPTSCTGHVGLGNRHALQKVEPAKQDSTWHTIQCTVYSPTST